MYSASPPANSCRPNMTADDSSLCQKFAAVPLMKDAASAFAYVAPSGPIHLLTRRPRSSSTGALQHHLGGGINTLTAKPAGAAGGRHHGTRQLAEQLLHRQCTSQSSCQRSRHVWFSLSATVAGDSAAPRLGKRRSTGRGEDRRNWGEVRFRGMMDMRPRDANKVDVARVMKELRDEGAELNLRAYRGCLAFLAKVGRGQEALMYLQEMESAGIAADNSCLGHVATACARGQNLDTALLMVRGMLSKGHEVSRTFNSIMLAIVNGQAFPSRERGSLNFRRRPLSNMECDKAVELLREMQACGIHPTVFTYNLLIAALTRSRRPQEEVLEMLDDMRKQGLAPDSYTYVGVVKGLQSPIRHEVMKKVLEDAKAELTAMEVSAVYSAVVSGFAADGSWEEATALVEEMFANGVPRDEYTYCAAMNACKEAGKWREAAAFLPKMKADGVPPNTIAYNTAIGACAFFGKPQKAWNSNRETSSFIRPTSAKNIKQGGHLSPVQTEASNAGEFALGLMEEMKQEGVEPDIITYGSLMSALSPRGAAGADTVLGLFEELQETDLTPNSIIFVSAIRAYGDKGNWQQAEKMLVEMKDDYGLELNRYCYSAVVKALANGGQWKRALEKLDEMRENGLSADPVVYTAAIGACEKYGQWEKALDTLSKLVSEKPPKNSLMWGYNAAISALGKAKQMEGVKDLLATMRASGLKPDEYTYAAMMRATGINGSWEESLYMLEEMESEGVRPNRVVYNTLLASLLKGDQYEKADEILKRMRDGAVPPDVTTYTTILSGCKRESDWKRAETLLSEMGEFGIKPNSRTLTTALKIYGDAGEVERALGLFEECDDGGLQMDVYCFNALMGPLLKKDNAEKVLELYSMMEPRGIKPDNLTMSMVLRAAELSGASEWAWLLMENIREEAKAPIAMHVYADAIRACCAGVGAGQEDAGQEGDDEEEEEGDDGGVNASLEGEIPRDEMPSAADMPEDAGGAAEESTAEGVQASPDMSTADNTSWRRAIELFDEARHVYEGENIGRLYTSIFVACSRDVRDNGKQGFETGKMLLEEMRSSPFPPDTAAFGPAASVLALGGDWEGAIETLKEGATFVGALPNTIAFEDVRAAAYKVGQLKTANERLDAIVYIEMDTDSAAAAADGGGSSPPSEELELRA